MPVILGEVIFSKGRGYGVQLYSGAMGKTDYRALFFPPLQFQEEKLHFYLFDIFIWFCLRLAEGKMNEENSE